MKLSAFSRPFGHSLLGTIGLGVLLGGVVPSAQAGSGFVRSGTDYVGTPIGGAKFVYPSPNPNPPPDTIPIVIEFTGFAIKSPTPNPLYNPTANPTTGIGLGAKGPDGGTTPIPNSGIPAILGVADTVINRTRPDLNLSLTNTLNTPRSIHAADPDCPLNGGMMLSSCTFGDGDETPIEIVGLSLISNGSVALPGFGSRTLYAGLEKYYGKNPQPVPPSPPYVPPTGQRSSTGTMFIRGDAGVGGTWDSIFTIHAFAFGLPTGSLLDTTVNDFVRTTLEGMITPLDISVNPYACQSNVGGMTFDLVCLPFTKENFIVKDKGWSATLPPGADTLVGPNLVPVDDPDSTDPNQFRPQDFFLTDRFIPHDAGDGSVHNVSIDRRDLKQYPVPGPLPILGASTAYAFARRLRKRCRDAVKVS
jgi:hypothetical protein